MTNVHYSKGWFRAQRRSVGDMDSAAARKLHDKGKLYTVVADQDAHLHAFMEVRLEVAFVAVGFLDLQRREVTSFVFSALGLDGRRTPPGICFLKSVIHSEFDDETDNAAFGTSYDYDFDGNCHVIRENLRTRETFDTHHRIDVSTHWEALPAFGQYEPFLRLDRWTPIDLSH